MQFVELIKHFSMMMLHVIYFFFLEDNILNFLAVLIDGTVGKIKKENKTKRLDNIHAYYLISIHNY